MVVQRDFWMVETKVALKVGKTAERMVDWTAGLLAYRTVDLSVETRVEKMVETLGIEMAVRTVGMMVDKKVAEKVDW